MGQIRSKRCEGVGITCKRSCSLAIISTEMLPWAASALEASDSVRLATISSCCTSETMNAACQLILWLASGASNEGPSSRVLALVPPFLGPGFRLGARWNRLGEAVKTRKKRDFSGKKWARDGLRSVNKEGTAGITCQRRRRGGGSGDQPGLVHEVQQDRRLPVIALAVRILRELRWVEVTYRRPWIQHQVPEWRRQRPGRTRRQHRQKLPVDPWLAPVLHTS